MSTTFYAPHIRVPRLSVRNRSPDALLPSVAPDHIQEDVAASPMYHLPEPRMLPDESAKFGLPDVPKRKPGRAVLNFLMLREPSSSALKVYAKQQRRLAAEKRGSIAARTATGAVGGSMQKMPAGVPKVNSKWDGLP